MILLSIGLVVALMLLGNANPVILWINWGVSGLLATGIWHIVARFRLDGGSSLRAYAISWPLLSLTSNFTYCYFPQNDLFYKSIGQQLALLAVITLVMSLWQRRIAILKHLLIGLVIGVTSALLPHVILWLLLFPLACYHMRSWSSRNMFSVITGVVLGIWFVYCGLFFIKDLPTANSLIQQFSVILAPDDYHFIRQGMGLWQCLFLAFIALLLLIYSASSLAFNAGQSVRAGASITLITTLSLAMVLLLLLDLQHLTTYIGILSLFLSLQLTIHQTNLRSALNEWWTIFIILIGTALCILPLVL